MKRLIIYLVLVILIITVPGATFVQGQLIQANSPQGWYVPINVMDVDINNDGIVNQIDLNAFNAAYHSKKGDANYVRCFDIDFDGDIDIWDKIRMNEFVEANLNLAHIRSLVLTGEKTTLTWDDFDVSVELRALDPSQVTAFTGTLGEKVGWLHGIWHSYETPNYVCHDFALDSAIAAYRGLGYGTLLYAASETHAYNLFYTGGDWHDLHNWNIFEPECGCMEGNAAEDNNAGTRYETKIIEFFYGSPYQDYDFNPPSVMLHRVALAVNYTNKTVDYSSAPDPEDLFTDDLEEPFPLGYTINTSGILGDINHDCLVNLVDLSILMSHWETSYSEGDLNADGIIDLTDLSILMSHWTG